ncbi:MAG: glycoside hydrolase family 32 protein [Lentisphaerae bacterium]|nr:glycoside hydrolase family 32 protein [Lentisphaerota bacterium]MCP4103649.1 glycoside hydrolase family 32 protein [Lentisphaerota bacterium]
MNFKRFIYTTLVLFITCAVSSGNAMTYQESLNAANVNVNNNIPNAISDPTYPIYHLRAPSGWINDPCGLFYFNSSFHIFTQSNPWGNQWGNMSWSHVVSVPDQKWGYKWFYPKDEKGIVKTTVIAPSLNSNAADDNGIFTGSVAILPFKEKNSSGKTVTTYYPTAVYSAVWGIDESRQEVIAMARALDANKTQNNKLIDPFLNNWTKYSTISPNDPDNNPNIIIKQPAELNLIAFRDPFIFRIPDDNNYYMIVSGGIKKENKLPEGIILLYKNDGKDLTRNWTRVNKNKDFFFSIETTIKDPVTGAGDIECGALYRLTDHIGTTNGTPYIITFGQDGSPSVPYSKSMYYVLGNIVKSKGGIKFVPLDSFKDANGNTTKKLLDLNPDFIFYSSNVLPVDNEQRNYLVSWLNIGSQAKDSKKYNWAGALSIPRFLYVYKENNEFKLGQDPVLVNALRKDSIYSSDKITFSDKSQAILLKGVKGRFLNISTIFKSKNILSSSFVLQLACSSAKSFPIEITKGKLIVNKQKPIDLKLPATSTQVKLEAYLDGAVLEIFISKYIDGKFITYSTYSSPLPSYGDTKSEGIKITGSKDVTAEINVYPMDTCWAIEKQAVPPQSKTKNGYNSCE